MVKPNDKKLVQTIEMALQLGHLVLLENCSEEIDPVLDPILLKQTFKAAGNVCISFADRTIEYNDSFRLQMTTKLRNPHFLPEVSIKLTLINFMITYDGLCEQLLNLVVFKENPALDEER